LYFAGDRRLADWVVRLKAPVTGEGVIKLEFISLKRGGEGRGERTERIGVTRTTVIGREGGKRKPYPLRKVTQNAPKLTLQQTSGVVRSWKLKKTS